MTHLLDKKLFKNQPSSEIKKFMFDCIFDTNDQREPKINVKYTAQDLLEAQNKSYSQGERFGFQQGQEEAQKGIYQQCADAINHYLSNLLEQHLNFEKKAHQFVAVMTSHIARTLLPAYMKQGALTEIINVIDQAFETLEILEVIIYVHPEMHEILCEKMKNFQEKNPLMSLKIQTSKSSFDLSDCRIEWQGGGLERRSKRIEEEVQTALSRLLSYANESENDLDKEIAVQNEGLTDLTNLEGASLSSENNMFRR